jgi:hypothetical protein
MTEPRQGSWRRDVMLITDESASFQKFSNEIAENLNDQGFAPSKVYASKEEKDNLAHQAAIRDGLDSGQLLVHFIGHGGRYIWRTGPPDLTKNHDLFTLDDVAGLENSGRLPMILSMTCYSAPFDNPAEDSIGERFLREADKGAVAVFAASWRNAPSTQFSQDLVRELLEPGATIGEAIVRAKGELSSRTLASLYNLLGDPAVVLKRPRDDMRLARDTDRWASGVLVQLPEARFRGKVLVDWLDGAGAVLASRTYHVDAAQFRLDIPASLADRAAEVRLYATSPLTGRDAVGALDLFPPPAEPQPSLRERLVAWWQDVNRPRAAPKPWTPDTIARGSFDDDDAPIVAEASPAANSQASGTH